MSDGVINRRAVWIQGCSTVKANKKDRKSGQPSESQHLCRSSEVTRDSGGAPRSDDSNRALTDSLNGQGAKSSNTAPSNLHCPPLSAPVELETGGVDTLELSWYGRFDSVAWKLLREGLNTCQNHAQNDEDEKSFLRLPNGEMIHVKPSGKGRGRAYSKWCFDYHGIHFAIRDNENSGKPGTEGAFPNISTAMGSRVLTTYGFFGALALANRFLKSISYQLYDAHPSRVDVCIDLVNVPLGWFHDAIEEGRFVTRVQTIIARKKRERVETIYIGAESNPTRLRMYDKYMECKDDKGKFEYLCKYRWGCVPDPFLGATRIEFQIRRRHLRDQHSIVHVVDLFSKMRSMVDWLMTDWFRITEDIPDFRHSERFGPSRLWDKCINAFQEWLGDVDEPRQKREMKIPNAERLWKQGIGCLEKAAAITGALPETIDDFQGFVVDRVSNDSTKRIWEKRRDLETSFPVTKLTSSVTESD